ncbi:MAG: sulfite exporter TauE/SafE family protein, partial [Ignavibacteriales bacterium]|nr:sulfite exporter TauE/SafE family protein [Ignavibacteriales bacterium]
YYRNGFFSWRLLFPFVTASIPMAFLGGMIPISQNLFSILLGLSLLFASARLFFLGEIKSEAENFSVQKLWMFGVPLGAILGLLSGMVGIGGGVFLSPILLFMKWTNAKQTAAIASAFIVLNSFSGITGHLTRANVDFTSSLPFVGAVFAGGFLGSRFGAEKFRLKTLQYLLAIVLLSAGTKLVSKLF